MKSPTFILEFEADPLPWESALVNKRLDAARKVYHAILGEGFKRLRLMRQSKRYQQARKAKGKERTRLFKELRAEFGFREYDFHTYTKSFTPTFLGDLVDADTRQKLATRAYNALHRYALGKGGRPRFKGKNQFDTVEGKSVRSPLKFKEGRLCWGKKLSVKLKIDWSDPVVSYGLCHRIKYVRLTRRMIRGQYKYYAQLVLFGVPLLKPSWEPGRGVVGVDVGPSTIAVVGENHAFLVRFCEELADKEDELRRLQRKLDRQRRANNPENYEEDGTIKRGKKRWISSKAMSATESKIKELHRTLAAHRKSLHGDLVKRILLLGRDIKCEKLSYRSFQRMFGKSVGRRGPGMCMNHLRRKAESAGGQMEEFSTYKTCLSQVCHGCGKKRKKKLSERVHVCSDCGVVMQRDLYSAYLARFVEGNELQVSQALEAWEGAETLLHTAWEKSEVARLPSSLEGHLGSGPSQSGSCANLNESVDQSQDVVLPLFAYIAAKQESLAASP